MNNYPIILRDLEPQIVINGTLLSEGQASALRVAVNMFMSSLDAGLGDDEHGRKMTVLFAASVLIRESYFVLPVKRAAIATILVMIELSSATARFGRSDA